MSKQSKYGRNKKRNPSSVRYTSELRWLKNKAKKLAKHLKKHPADVQSSGQGSVVSYKRKVVYWWELLLKRKL